MSHGPAPPETAAQLTGVSHHYKDVQALDDMHLTVTRGQVLAVLGPNGAGKTTAIELLLGTLPLQQGRVEVLGGRPRDLGVRMRRGAMLQKSGVPGTLRVAEHIDLFRGYYPNPLPATRLIDMAGLDAITDRRFDKLSGGQKQRLMFALALAGDPELVFLDEPTTGLDLEARRRLWAEIRAMKDTGRTVVLTTHYLEEADALADRIVVIDKGRVLAEGTPAEIKARTAGKQIRCVTQLDSATLLAFPGVTAVDANGHHAELLVTDAEAALRALLDQDPSLADVTVAGAGLEQAFLALTRDSMKEAS